MYPFIKIDNFLPNLKADISKGFPNVQGKFCKYLLHIIMEDSNELLATNGGTSTISSFNMEQYRYKVLRKRLNDTNQLLITVDELVPYFQEECLQKFLSTNFKFARYFLHLLMRDAEDGLELNDNSVSLSLCKIEQFLEKALKKYGNPLDATVCNIKITYFLKNCQEINLDFVKEKYELDFQEKLKKLTGSILQYPETSKPQQLEEMFVKMQVFIIANYHLGCPKNQVLLKQTRQSLNSVLGKGDLQKYVMKKKYHRLAYLQKLGTTVAGIVIFNNQGPQGEKENMRNILADLQMAQFNTKESLEEGIKKSKLNIEKGSKLMQEVIKINTNLGNVQCLWPLTKIRELNKFVILFEVNKRNLQQLKEVFEKTQYLVEVAQKKFICVVDKINEILKYRSAIESQLIFPHFVYLSEIWSSLVLYLNHLVELNKIKDHFDELLNENLENKFLEMIEEILANYNSLKHYINLSFQQIMATTNKNEGKLNMVDIKPYVKDYCALTMALTNGILVPSQLDKKLCENEELRFGFAHIEYAKYAEHYFKDFLHTFRNSIFTCSDLILLFQLDDKVIEKDFDLINQTTAKTKCSETQTEMAVENDLSTSNKINVTWNVWDYHRETIKLANLRQKYTHSSQSKLCYGIRNSQNQAYNTRDNYTQK